MVSPNSKFLIQIHVWNKCLLYASMFLIGYVAIVTSSVQLLSCVRLWDPIDSSMPGHSVHHQLPEFTQTHVLWVSDAIQPSHPLLSPSPPTFNLSQHQGLFQWVSSSHQVAKFWSFSFSTSPSSEYSGLISFRMDWLDLLEVQAQYHSSKASILQCSAFCIVQLSHPYMTTGKTIVMYGLEGPLLTK